MAQAGLVADALRRAEPGLQVEIVQVTTVGDEGGPAAVTNDKSRFVKEIEEALLADRADLAVHSAKDVPAVLPDGLAIVGVPERGDPRDAWCGVARMDDLSRGARVGTASLRRRSQLLARRPDLDVVELRGNVDTRLRRLQGPEFDALVLAAAGLERLEVDGGAAIAPSELLPAPGQGCLALEARAADSRARDLAENVTDPVALVTLTAERALTAGLGAGCRTPVAALAEIAGEQLHLDAYVGLPDGSAWIRDAVNGDPADPAEVGRIAAARMLAAGASELLAAADAGARPA